MLNCEVYNDSKNHNWVVFVHGIGGSTLTWKKQIDDFSDKHNLLLIDLPGHGVSHNMGKCTMDNLSEEIKETLDYYNINKADFVGMSLGTIVIAEFAIKYPQYVTSIVFGGAAIKVTGVGRYLVKIARKCQMILPYRWIYNLFAVIIMPRKNHKISRDFFIKESLKMEKESFFKWTDYFCYFSCSDNLIQNLKIINKKILFISGNEDRCFLKGAKNVAFKLGNTVFKIILNCGHVCTIEKYKEFNKIALSFIEQVHSHT